MIYYCDACKIDSRRFSRSFYITGEEVYDEDSTCPVCKHEQLDAYRSFEDIP